MLKRCLTLVCSVYVLSLLNISDAAAKICFLPDGNCGKTKININSGENGCIYKDKGAAETGMSKCEIAFQRNSCWWRRCNSDNKTIFDDLADCQKKIEDATSQKCQACGSCYKLVTIPIPPNACPDGYSTKYQSPSDCGANESFSENGTYNGKVCGACTRTETCPSGYSTQYQSQSDCPTGETFSSSGSVGNLTCGKCEKTEACNYVYRQATPSDTCGQTKNLNDGCCRQGLSKVASVEIQGGTGSVMPIYNKISHKSATCVQNNVTKYETICEGTAKPNCKKTFTPNGCVSDSYNNGFDVIGTEWGTCGCDTSKGAYETSQECRNATGKGCTSVADGCYKSCESLGYYSTEAACKTDLPNGYRCLTPGAAGGNSSCYVRGKIGWGIHYAHDADSYNARTCSKDNGGGSDTWSVYVATRDTASETFDINGEKKGYLDSGKEYRYYAGDYSICIGYNNAFMVPVSLYFTSGSNETCQYTYSSNGSRWNTVNNTICKGTPYGNAQTVVCFPVSLKDGEEYYIGAGMTYINGCTSKKYQ